MKIMKKIFFNLLIVIGIVLMGGCEDKLSLDLKPVSSVTDANYWIAPEHFEIFMNGVHSRFRAHSSSFQYYGEVRSDVYYGGPLGGATQLYERESMNTLTFEYCGRYATTFGGYYTNINQLNLYISKTISTDLLDEAEKGYYLGQAYGLRAFYYFQLLRTWGEVVLVTEPILAYKIDELAKPASSVSEVMQAIKQDIDNSTSSFGSDYSFKSKTIWSKAATLMLKSEAYLWAAKAMGGGNADATVAKAALTEIQTNIPSLSLVEDFGKVFSCDNKENEEIIFAVHSEVDEYLMLAGINEYLPRIQVVENYYDSLTGANMNINDHLVITPGGAFYVTVNRNVWWKYSDLDSRKWVSGHGVYDLVNGDYVLLDGSIYLNKFQGLFDLGVRTIVNDWPVYRYADLLLMLAEAKAMTGDSPANEINLVRERAFGNNYQAAVHGYPNQAVDSDINEALLQERLFEFIGEGKRWYDLIRYGDSYLFKYTTCVSPFQKLWPLDIAALTNNKSLNQNPGY